MSQEQCSTETLPEQETDATALPAVAEVADSASHGGAPLGNSNRLESGVIAWVRHGGLPRSHRALRAELEQMGEALADEVLRLKGREPTLYEKAVIQSAIKHHGRLALLERWLAKDISSIPLDKRMDVLKEIGAAATSRDKAMKSIGLDKDISTLTFLDICTPQAS